MPTLNYNPEETHVIYRNFVNGKLFAAPASSALWKSHEVIKRVKNADEAQAYIDGQRKLGLHIRQN